MDPTTSAPTAAEAVASAMTMLEELHGVLRVEADCPGRARALRAWQAANLPRLEQIKGGLKAHPPDVLEPEVKAQMAANADVGELFAQARGCLSDPDFATAWEAISAVME